MMPKGFKSKNGYGSAKLLDGMTYHEISSEMKSRGYKMNHSSCRNEYIKALTKIAKELSSLYDLDHDDKKLKSIAIDPDFQESIKNFMDDMQDGKKTSKFNI
jgi:hypothetical protein